MAKQPTGPPPPPVVQRLRLRYTKRGRLRFTSHRDIARSFERALRRAQVPMAYSAGFSPHPRISWVGAAPTGVASEAEYVEICLAVRVDPEQLRLALDASLPDGIDVVEVVEADPRRGKEPGAALPDRVQASHWRVLLPGVTDAHAEGAITAFLAAESVPVQRLTKDGSRELDARAAVVRIRVLATPGAGGEPDGQAPCATLDMVVRHMTPAVRPDDVLTGLRLVGALQTPVAPSATRVSQGPLTGTGEVGDPLAPDRVAPAAGAPGGATRAVDALEQSVAGAAPSGTARP